MQRATFEAPDGLFASPSSLARVPPFELGPITVEPALRRLVAADGKAVTVEPLVMQVLIALAGARGEPCTRDDLVARCWGRRIVGDDAVNKAISHLRRSLAVGGEKSVWIETIPKVGYRLRADGPFAPIRVAARSGRKHRHRVIAATAAAVLLAIAGAWWTLRPAPVEAHSMAVRLIGFRLLSADLPTTLREEVGAEIVAAFNADGVIGVSTASAPPPGTAPAYALGGTIHRVGDSIRVITRFTNERTGAVLWSDSTDYAADQVSSIPHKIAVDAGIPIRCGLSGAATYRQPLPDTVFSSFMQYCQEEWAYGGTKTALFAQRVVAAVPDFSWGWSGVETGFMQASYTEPDSRRAEAMRAAGLRAADKALALDPKNSEALDRKAFLIDPRDWTTREALHKSAIAARPLDCGCEHYGYGFMLEGVGRLGDAIEQFGRATDALALWPDSELALAEALVATGRGEQARKHFNAAIDLSKDANFDKQIAIAEGTETGDYAAAIAALRNPQLQMPEETRAALLSGYQALASGGPQAKTKAITLMISLPADKRSNTVATLLAALGANHQALQVASQRPTLFWRRSMRRVLDDPAFPTVANQLGLIAYWKTTRTRPDVCWSTDPPPFCQMV